MNELLSLDILRTLFEEIAKAKVGGFDSGKLSIDYGCNMDEACAKYAGLLNRSIEALNSGGSDDLVAQRALMMIRTHAISLSSFFDAIADDAEFLIRSGVWTEIPE
ncbi:hypothetical protein [Stutzerimonas frequens]|uniref:hypothetical protein n=1 Tax=Stutzerimonas frequens TaxID=2968969 RepID=UPI0025561993|nr:hypothetical protein [Stutzerimonas frequens]MDL0438118.1 hypothetical protein [Stutzerimonas frequens]